MKGIIFDSESVAAILRGDKTQTRRIVKPQPPDWVEEIGCTAFTPDGKVSARGRHPTFGLSETFLPRPRYRSGETVYVREAFGTSAKAPASMILSAGVKTDMIAYRADDPEGNWCWRSPLHMPEWAARIKLEITNVRVERLQDISEGDVVAEGLPNLMDTLGATEHFGEFEARWDAINGKRAPWQLNPWVWVYEFRKAN